MKVTQSKVIRPQGHISVRKNEKYIDGRSTFVTIGKKNMNEL